MITIFSIPKPFNKKHTIITQTNAIRSWTKLEPTPEILLLGNEEGISEIAKELNIRHIPDIKYNEYGTPLLDSSFQMAESNANNKVLCYVNADIILLQELIPAVKEILQCRERFLIVSQRWDLTIDQLVDFNSPSWAKRIRSVAKTRGSLHEPTGIDLFIFPIRQFERIRPFAVGRPRWDNWLLWRARSLDIPIIDVTSNVMIIHQDHETNRFAWHGPEAIRNGELAGSWLHLYDVSLSTYKLKPDGLKYNQFHPWMEPIVVNAKLFIKHGYAKLLDQYLPLEHAPKLRKRN